MKRILIIIMALLIAAPDVFPQRVGVGVGVGFKKKKKAQTVTTIDPAAYYVNSATGSDSNDGITPATAFASITKVNTLDLTGTRHKVLFAKGDTLSGTITPGQSGTSGKRIIYGAYGTGANPVITGFTKVTGFTKRSNTDVYVKYVANSVTPEILTVNGVQQAKGRTPNSNRFAPKYADYYHIDSYSGTTQITDSECNAATTDWDNAEIVIRTANHMNWLRSTISSHSSTTLTFTNSGSLSLAAGYGYFIQNDLRTLDQFGEWYFNPTTDTLYFYGNPAAYTIKISTVSTLIDVTTRDYITVNGLNLQGANANAIETNVSSYANNLTVSNCDFLHNNRCIYANAAPELTVQGCTMRNSSFMAIYHHWDSDGAYIANNTIDSTGLVIGVGAGEGPYYNGMALYSCYGHHTYSDRNTIIEYNTVLNSGYHGILFGSDSAKVRYNFVSNYNQIKSDGGAIYYGFPEAYPHLNQTIDHNICLNGRTQTDSLGMPQNQVTYANYNIYLDNNSNGGFTITNNTSAHTKGTGLMVHMSEDIIIQNNTIYDCETGVKFQEQTGYLPSAIREIDMQNNIVVAKKSAQKNVSVRSLNNDFNLFGTINNNYYARPFDGNPMFITMVNTWAETPRDSIPWRSTTTWDANSTFSKIQIQNDDSVRFYTNPTASSVVYALNDTLVDALGAKYNASVTVPAYGSKILWNDDEPAYTVKKLGIQTVGGSAAGFTTRTAVPYTLTENGQITAIVIYHNGNLLTGGRIALAVYDNTGSSGKPGTKLAETNIQPVQSFTGWQRINLKSALTVTNGQTIWLAWITEKSTFTYYTVGTPGYAWTTGNTWANGLPSSYGTSTQNNSLFSAYFIYK